jgi:ubiquinone/menaquinone biosynthesis C-methylase UbiE
VHLGEVSVTVWPKILKEMCRQRGIHVLERTWKPAVKRATLESVGLARVFDDRQFARNYARHMAKRGRKTGRQFASLLKQRGLDGGRILDAGCGAGQVAIELARAFPTAAVLGVELSVPLLGIAEAAAKDAHLSSRALWGKADVESLPFADDAFDVVVNVNMLHHVERPVAMLNEMERVLAPRGVLILEDIKRSWLGWLDRAFRSAFTWPEAKAILQGSRLRPWTLEQGTFGFRIFAGQPFTAARGRT